MLDDLDLVFEDQDPGRRRGSHRRGARTRRPREGRAGRSFVALTVTAVILALLGTGVWFGVTKFKDYLAVPDYNSGGAGEVVVTIKDGAQGSDIAQTLYKQDVVKSPKAFVVAAKANTQSRQIQPGTYKMRQKMRAADAVQLMLDPTSRVVNGITIAEGMVSTDIFKKLSDATHVPLDDFVNAAKDLRSLGVSDAWFTRDDGKQTAKSIEGFLYPATYEFKPNTTAVEMLSAMVAKFNAVMTKLDFLNKVRADRHISPYEALIVASIAQAEAGVKEDIPPIARVLYNRAYGGKFPCGCLQLDSTVNYWFRISGQTPKDSKHLTDAELHNPANPYNTHDVPGLPIGPISNPGEEALQGALNPTPGDWVYFVTVDKQGHSKFSTTYEQFQLDVALAKQNGVL